MEMKKIIFTLFAVVTAFCAYAQETEQIGSTRIDFDYDRTMRIIMVQMDTDCDGEIGEGETIVAPKGCDWFVSITYRDFGSAGSRLYFSLDISMPDGGSRKFIGTLDDAVLLRTTVDGEYAYGATNGIGELQFSIATAGGRSAVAVYNTAFLRVE